MSAVTQDEQRRVEHRAQYIDRTTDLSKDVATALAWKEFGYTASGIAKRLDVTESTVDNYLQEVTQRFGHLAATTKVPAERGDLQTRSRCGTVPPAGDRVVLGDEFAPSYRPIERFYRSWVRDGRLYRQEKLAFRIPENPAHKREYDRDRLCGRLNSLDWDTHHCTYDAEYSFTRADVDNEAGAWTCDSDAETLSQLAERGIEIKDFHSLPVVASVLPFRLDNQWRQCPACEHERVCSANDLAAYARTTWTDAMQICDESGVVSHVCTHCSRLLQDVTIFDEDNEAEHDDGLLVEAMK